MPLSDNEIEDLRRRREAIREGGGAAKHAARREKGQYSPRERLNGLFEQGSFQEIGMHVRHRSSELGGKDLPADGVVTGTGYVDGRLVAGFAQDFTVAAGTLGKMHAAKIVELMKFAMHTGVPLVAFQDSGGARIQEGVDALSGYGDVFYHNVLMSGVAPQIAVICGPCAGGAAYSPALMDFIIMTRKNAHMFITGPAVIKSVTGRQTSMDEVGSPQMHASVSGNVHFVAEDEPQALRIVHELLSYLPANNTEDPPHDLGDDLTLGRDETMNDLVPDDAYSPMDVRAVIEHIVDDGRLLEIQAEFARNLIIGFARIEGMVVGVVANQPMHLAGALDIDAADKGARFIRMCNAFNIPLVTLVDVPGFLPGIEQERGGIIRHGAKLLFAYASCTVPKVTLILRKAYGGSYLAMCSREMGADAVFSWPDAQIAVMGAEGAVDLLHRRKIQESDDPTATRAHLLEEYRTQVASAYLSAERGYITDVIEPSESRAALALTLRKNLTKRELRPAKKHGNIPL